MQQAVSIEGVVDAAAALHVEPETHLQPALADRIAVAVGLLGCDAVLLYQVLGDVLAARAHVGVQFEGLEMQIDLQIGPQAANGLLQGIQADGAPWAGHIGDEIDLHDNTSG